MLFDATLPGAYETRAGDLDPPHAPKQSRQPGPRIIFRLDDVEQGVREKQVLAIVSVFEEHDAPLELGFIPYVNGEPSFAPPRLQPYIAKGVADVSVHGVTHRQHEFHSGESGTTRKGLARGLLKASNALREYYGVQPVAFLVPYDVFDEAGYNAVRDAGFPILSFQWQTDRHRGTEPVGFNGQPHANGLYRLPSVDDAVAWNPNQQSWGSSNRSPISFFRAQLAGPARRRSALAASRRLRGRSRQRRSRQARQAQGPHRGDP